jgi:CubicO group peptidase (beta-lactamase class C family)
MKKQLLISFCLLLAMGQRFAQQPDKAEKLKEIIQSVNLPGIQLLYSKDGHRESYNLGVISARSMVPVTSESIFEAASLSKAVFAYSVLRLADRGVISLDTPLLQYMGGSYDQFYPGNPAYSKITARMVLCHRTGFRNWRDADKIRLLFPPDSCFNYSGEAYMFLLAVVEKITHKDLEQIGNDEVFVPLGMKNSSFRWNPKFAKVSTFGSDSSAIKRHSALYAASSLLTNALDYTIFLEAVESGKGLKPETHRLMLSQQSAGNWFNHPAIEATKHIGWGLGVGIQTNEKGTAIWQWGDNGDFRSFYIDFPASHERLIYFTSNFRGHYITQDVVDLFLGKQTTWCIPWVRNGYSDWDGYAIGYADPYAVNRFRAQLIKQGYAQAGNIWKKEKQQNPGFTIPEGDMRVFARILAESGQKNNALAVLKLNAAIYTNNANALAGLAEGFRDIKNIRLAKSYARQSLKLDPGNKHAQTLVIELDKE